MNLLNKTTPWVAASLLAAASAFGQGQNGRPQRSCEPPHEVPQAPLVAAYNAPARVDVRGSWDFYAQGSFTYWQPRQENMELALTDTTTLALTALDGNFVNLNFKYKPGFKVGIGMNFETDNWDGFAEYAWHRGTHHSSTNGPVFPGGLITLWGHPILTVVNPFYNEASEKWRLGMDLLNLELARNYYTGTKLTFRPHFGARAAWIRQNLNVRYTNTVFSEEGAALGTLASSQTTHSWGVGPRAGIYTNWMIGEGFRLFGNGAADILYTRYTKLRSHDSFTTAAGTVSASFVSRQKDLDYLRTHTELELGLGWGSYFDNNNWHIDLAASYGFQAFDGQNMFRNYNSATDLGNSTCPHGDLFVHGLNVDLQLDF